MKTKNYRLLDNFVINNPDVQMELGKLLYTNATKSTYFEIDKITEKCCIEYILYSVTKKTIYGQLQQLLNTKIESAPDTWDRLYNVDFFIQIGEQYIGLQIKPINKGVQLPEIHKEYALQEKTHQKFTEKFGGKVFYILSAKNGDKREIVNKEVVEEIKTEMERLNNTTM